MERQSFPPRVPAIILALRRRAAYASSGTAVALILVASRSASNSTGSFIPLPTKRDSLRRSSPLPSSVSRNIAVASNPHAALDLSISHLRLVRLGASAFGLGGSSHRPRVADAARRLAGYRRLIPPVRRDRRSWKRPRHLRRRRHHRLWDGHGWPGRSCRCLSRLAEKH